MTDLVLPLEFFSTLINVFSDPGTGPLTKTILLTSSLAKMLIPLIVKRSPPYLPDIRVPGHTRPGDEPAPIEPGDLCLSDWP